MRKIRIVFTALALLSALAPARAAEQASYVTPTSGPMSMATLAGTYINPALRAIASCHNGASAPANGPSGAPLAYQCWVDTTANPSLYKIYDGASWITLGSINTSTNVWLPYLTGGVSGGVPFFSASNVMGTSALLEQYGFMVGGGAGAAPATIAACSDDQIAFGVTSAAPVCRSVSGDLTFATGVATIGATKVTSAMLNADVFSTAHSWGGTQTFTAPVLGTPASGTLTNTTGLPISTGLTGAGTGVLTALGVNVGSAGAPVVNGGALGTPSSGTLTNATGLPVSTGISGFGAGVATALGNAPNAAGGLVGFSGALGTPTAGTLTNATGLPISTGLTGAGTGVLTALGVNVGSAGAPVVNGGVLGTPSSGTLTNATGLPIGTGVSGLGTGIATALAVNTGSAGAPVLFNGALGTPSSGILTSATGLPITTGLAGAGTGVLTALGNNLNASGGVAGASRSISTGCGLAGGGDLTADRTLRSSLTINAQTGTTYTVDDGDCGKVVSFDNGSAVAVTLPQANGSTFVAGWNVAFQNKGAGTVTITPTTSTVNGGASIALTQNQGMHCSSDASNYTCVLGVGAGGGSGTVTNVATAGLATGGPISASGTITVTAATASDQETATSSTTAVTPSVQQRHPTAAKAYISCNAAGTVLASYNMSSCGKGSTGLYTPTFTTDFSSTAYVCAMAVAGSGGTGTVGNKATGSIDVRQVITSTGALVDNSFDLVCFGDQ